MEEGGESSARICGVEVSFLYSKPIFPGGEKLFHIRRIFVMLLTLFVFSGLTTTVAFAQDPDNGKVLWEEQIW